MGEGKGGGVVEGGGVCVFCCFHSSLLSLFRLPVVLTVGLKVMLEVG